MKIGSSMAAAFAFLALGGCGGSGGSGGGETFYVLLATDGIVGSDYTIYRFKSNDRDAKAFETTENLFLQGMDQRPANGTLYTYDPLTEILYTVDLEDGRFHIVAQSPDNPPDGSFVMDFNPSADRIRLIDRLNGNNLRLHPETAILSGLDTDINPVSEIGEIAYTNNVAGAATTTLYGINNDTLSLVRIGGVDGNPSANGGAVTNIGSLGLVNQAVRGFDIAADGTAYVLTQADGLTTVNLHTVDLTTGAATFVGSVDGIPDGGLVTGFAHFD